MQLYYKQNICNSNNTEESQPRKYRMEKCKYICSKIGTEYDFTATKSVDIEAIKHGTYGYITVFLPKQY